MKKVIITLSLLLCIVLCVTALVACDDTEQSNVIVTNRVSDFGKEYFELNETNISLTIGQTFQLVARYYVKQQDTLAFASSDTGIVTVSDTGIITAVGSGSAIITASYGKFSATCNVTVGFGGTVGKICLDGVDGANIGISVDGYADLSAYVDFNGHRFEFSAEYTVQDTTVGAVNEGKFIPSKIGTTTVTVGGNWLGQSLVPVSVNITVKAIPEFIVRDGDGNQINSLDIYTRSDFGGKTYSKTLSYSASATFDGQPVSVTTSIDDPDDVVLETSGKITSRKSGEASLIVSFTQDGTTYSKAFPINVLQPVADYDQVINVDVSKGVLPVDEIFASYSPKQITSIVSEDNLTLQDGKVFGFTVDNEKSQRLTVYNGTVGYNLTVVPYTRIFTSAEELEYFSIAAVDEYTLFDGYYILGCNIDASSYNHNGKVVRFQGMSIKQVPQIGLTGTFDGKGYTIDGLTVGTSGLFGLISGGTVKNVGFTNVKYKADEDSTLLACYITDSATVSNVYIQADMLDGQSRKGYRNSLVATEVNINCSVENCIFVLENDFVPTVGKAENWCYGSFTYMCSQRATLSNANPYFLKNTYVISPAVMTYYAGNYYVDTRVYQDRGSAVTYPNVKHYFGFAEMASADNDYSSFNPSYWTIQDGVPVWKTAVK